MTKITEINEGLNISQQNKPRKAEDGLFEKSLNQAMNISQGTKEIKAPDGLGEIHQVSFAPVTKYVPPVVEKTGKLLDRLENYARNLENPDVSLRDLEPVITDIENSAAKLLRDAENTPGADPALKSLAKQTAAMANAEYIKFQRGDYN